MRTSDFDYTLPPELIAQSPADPRDSSRLMVLSRAAGSIEHRRFFDIADYLKAGDLLVLNNTRVVPARLAGRRRPSGGKVEALLLRRIEAGVWEALVRPGRRLREGDEVVFSSNGVGSSDPLEARVLGRTPSGTRLLRLSSEGSILSLGQIPLPPYIRQPLSDTERYQTVYSTSEGSVAAPTAGLHFTQELLQKVRNMGIELAFVTLHIGLDTFRPVREDDPTLHPMHREPYCIEKETADLINRARSEGRRIVVVGTSAARVLEQAALDQGVASGGLGAGLQATSGWASLLILPGHRFQLVDAIITNFHLPRSTLLMMVSAFAGRETVLNAYQEAIKERYRFYSFGDAMLIL